MVQLHQAKSAQKSKHTLILADSSVAMLQNSPDKTASAALDKILDEDEKLFTVIQLDTSLMGWTPSEKTSKWERYEKLRKLGSAVRSRLRETNAKELLIVNACAEPGLALHVAEGFMLAEYSFDKYFTSSRSKNKKVMDVYLRDTGLEKNALSELKNLVSATFFARDLVNEPQNFLTATKLAEEIERSGKETGFKVEVFNKSKIKALKMGGLLAVNQGSPEPPTFTIMEWKPAKAKNSKPIVLVGKGVVYDTGGLSLKPTPNSMDMMKCDMAGAAAVAGCMAALASNKIPLHVIGLVPATDNRPGQNAYAPGDVITMMSGTTVEVLNTDAEGRLILADALYYAKRYKPELVIDLATLTGAAVRALGTSVSAVMGTTTDNDFDLLFDSGLNMCERVVRFPLWSDYNESLKSSIADITNLGGPEAGHITAGIFLQHFSDFPWIHIDIAGPAFLTRQEDYRPKGGTGVGVRLLMEFLAKKYELKK